MITYFPKTQGKLAFQDGTEKVTVYQNGDSPDYYVYFISNDLPIADLLSLVDSGVLFQDYPFKVKLTVDQLENISPLRSPYEGNALIKDIPTPHEYSNDESEVLIGAILQTQGKSGRYLNQSELQAFRGAGYELLGKADIVALRNNNDIWKQDEII